MASKEVVSAIEPMAHERDHEEFALGDTLDIKTGLILASLTFLAIQSGEFINSNISSWVRVAQYISVASLIIGGAMATVELWPINYEREATPDKYVNWLENEGQGLTGQSEEEMKSRVAQLLAAGRMERTLERIKTNVAANQRKSRFMRTSFFFMVLSFAVNVGTLFIRLLS
jgi:hypothetical protein